jgi:hypothetical protein
MWKSAGSDPNAAIELLFFDKCRVIIYMTSADVDILGQKDTP